MPEMTFTINDQSTGGATPVVEVHIVENADGTVTIRLTQLNASMNYLGDLRGFFMDLSNEALLGTLSVSGSELTLANGSIVSTTSAWTSGNDSVSSTGSSSNNMNGMLGTDRGFDFGIEIGTEGVGAKGDDVRSFEFTMGSSAGPVTLADFANVNFGVRITSVGLDTNGDGIIDTARNGSVKMLEQGAATTGPNAIVYVDDDVFNGGAGGTGDQADSEATTGILAHSYSSGTVALTGVDFPVGLNLSVVTLTPTLIVISQDGTNVLEIRITDPATGAYEVTQLAPMLHPSGGDENDILFTIGYDAVSSDGDTASGVLTINVNDDSVLFLASSELEGSVTENGSLVTAGHVDFAAADGATAAVDGSQTTLSYVPDGGPSAPLPAGLDADAIIAAFSITDPATGTWSFDAAAIDLDPLGEGDTITLTYAVVVTDADGDAATDTVTVTITGTNDAPTVSATAAAAIVEAADASAQDLADSGTVDFDDIDANDVVDISFASDGDPVWSDGTLDPALAAQLVAGFSTGVTDADAPGSTPWSYSVTGADLDFLSQGETITFSYTVTATDSQGDTATDTVSFTITGTNDAPVANADVNGTDVVVESGVNPGNTAFPGDPSAAGDVLANDTDADTGAALSVAAVNGLEANVGAAVEGTYGSVTINGDGTWSYSLDNADPQTQALAQGASVTDIFTYTVTDQHGATSSTSLTITITGTNDAPAINSNGGGATAAVSVGENTTAVTTITATDPDTGAILTFAITGGADAAKFQIDPDSGALSFISAPDFENPQDSGGNNVYDVEVTASDGTAVDTQSIAVTVTNVNEAPTITSNGGGNTASVNVAENSTAVSTVVATDVDAGTTITYSIVGGADGATFQIDPNTGALSFIAAPNFEVPTDAGADNVYDVVVQASDGSLVDTQAIAVTVTDVNAAPTITSDGGGASAALNVAENATAVTTVVATDDGENNNTLTYSIVGGADAAKFSINSSTGALSFVNAPDFEAPTDAGGDNVYDVIVQASDGSLVDTQSIAVSITNTNEAPTITSNGGGTTAAVSVAENMTAVTTVVATDVDAGTTITYSISGGADAGKFTINSSTGALSFVSAPDFENPQDAGADNVYDVVVQASDGSLVDTQAIAVTVTDVNAAPAITSNGGGATASVSVAENITAVTMVAATDDGENNNTLTYSIVGGADAAKFSINSSTGALSFVSAPDFEAPTDVGGNNVYDVVVQASDGSLVDTQAIAVSVTDVAESALYLRITQPNPNGNGNDTQHFDNFKVIVNGVTYNFSDLVVVSATGYITPDGSNDFGSTGQSGNARTILFQIPGAPANASVQVMFDYSIDNRNGTNNDNGAIFAIGTTTTTFTTIADYSDDSRYAANPITGGAAHSFSFNYSVSGSTVTVSSLADPIILDLGAAGISLSNSASFDMDGDGRAQPIAWTTGEDGILVVDLNNSGSIESGEEVISPWFSSGGFADSLDALASLDSNGDGTVDSSDAAFADIKVWVDANSDGVAQAGELLSLTDLGIASINVAADHTQGTIDGQNVIGNGTFTYATGEQGQFAAVELTETQNRMMYVGEGSEEVLGSDGDDLLFASNLGNALNAGIGDDVLYSGGADDTLSGGEGNDEFVLGATGIDTITDYSDGDAIDISSILSLASDIDPIAGGYLRVTTTGLVQVDIDGGGNNWTTLANINLGPASYSIVYGSGDSVATVEVAPVAPPIALDLDGDGQISFVDTDAGASFDYGGGTVATAWVAANDGILVRDGNHDGQVSADEIVFATSGSDLEGLARYDSNGDGQLSDADAGFADFGVWQDADGDGRVDAGELQSLAAHSIASISLSSDGQSYTAANGDVTVVGTGSFTRADGSTGVLADAVFATGGRVSDDSRAALTATGQSTLVAAAAVAVAGLSNLRPASETLDRAPGDDAEVVRVTAQSVPMAAEREIALNPQEAVELAGNWHASVRPASTHQSLAELESDHSLIGSETYEPADLSPLSQGSEPAMAMQLAAPPMVALPSAELLAAAMGNAEQMKDGEALLAEILSQGTHGQAIDALLDAALPNQGGDWQFAGGMTGQPSLGQEMFAGFVMRHSLPEQVQLVHPDAISQA